MINLQTAHHYVSNYFFNHVSINARIDFNRADTAKERDKRAKRWMKNRIEFKSKTVKRGMGNIYLVDSCGRGHKFAPREQRRPQLFRFGRRCTHEFVAFDPGRASSLSGGRHAACVAAEVDAANWETRAGQVDTVQRRVPWLLATRLGEEHQLTVHSGLVNTIPFREKTSLNTAKWVQK